MKKTISIHGAYFGANFGDHLLIRILIDWVRTLQPDTLINLPMCPEKNRRLLGADDADGALLDSSAAFIFAGGGYFGEPAHGVEAWTARNYRRYVEPGLRAAERGIPVAVIGVGVGPISDLKFRAGVVKIVNAAKVVTVRDEESFAFLREYGADVRKVTVTADSALLVGEYPRLNESLRNEVRQGLGIRPNERLLGVELPIKRGETGYESVAAQLRGLRTFEGQPVRCIRVTDGCIGKRLPLLVFTNHVLSKNRVGWKLVRPPSVTGVLDFIHACDSVVTSKLHIGIVATAMRKPVLSVPAHPKTRRFYRQVGLARSCIPLHDFAAQDVNRCFTPFEPEADAFDGILHSARANKSAVRRLLCGD